MRFMVLLLASLVIPLAMTSRAASAATLSKVYADGGNLYFEQPGANYNGCSANRYIIRSSDFRYGLILSAFMEQKQVFLAPAAGCLNNSTPLNVIFVTP